MKRYATTVIRLAYTLLKRFFRDPVALFFTFLFPLLLLFVFGTIFSGNGDVKFDVALINRSDSAFSKQFEQQIEENKIFTVESDTTSFEDAQERMGRGELDSIIELPQTFGVPGQNNIPSGKVLIYYDESSPQTGQTLGSIMQSVLDGINQELTHTTDPFTVEQRSTATTNLTQFDFTFSGLLGFSLLALGIFGMANGFPADKKAGILRRLRASPLRASQLIAATALEYLVIGVLTVVMMMLVGSLVFGFEMRGDYLTFSIFALLGIILMFGFGLAIGGWAKNENQSAPLSNLVALPLMFLSGTFFPRFLMPDWLQSITAYLPLTPIIDGLRYIMTEGQTLWQLGPQLAIIGVWTIVIYALAIKVFRWE